MPSVLRKLSGERNSVLLPITLSAIKLPARGLICDYGMSATWHECTAKLTKAMGISWPRVKKNIEKHMPLESPSALSVWAFWVKPKVHILPLWSLSTKHFGFLITYLSRQKISPHRPPRVDLRVARAMSEKVLNTTPGLSDISLSHFVFSPWQWLKTLRQP